MSVRNRGRKAWGAAAALAALAAMPAGAGPAALKSLVAAERAFSALSVEKGIRASFLTYLAPSSVVFRPTPTDGRKAMMSRPEAKTPTLIWEPSFAEVSAAGDLGYDSGPWELRYPAGAQPTLYGHFISVWKKQVDGAWRVVADIGITHDRPASGGVGSNEFTAGPAHAAPAAVPAAKPSELRQLDAAYSKAARAQGFAAAFAAHATKDVRFNTDGAFPFLGLEAARAQLARAPGVFEFHPQGSGLAASRDLGYTYGLAPRFEAGASSAADSSVYLHVWRRDASGPWRLALAVMNPLPKPGAN
jgi:ketosteroid isomerase-like protein